MYKISILLILVSLPVSLAAQVTYSNKVPDADYRLDNYELKVDQQYVYMPLFWLNIGVGFSTAGLTGITSASYQTDEIIVSLRYSHSSELFSGSLWDIGILIGGATIRSTKHVSLAGGLAVVSGTKSNGGLFSSAEDFSPTVGFPIELQAYKKFNEYFGLGATGFANFNTEQSFAGLALTLQLGWLQ